MKRNKRKQLKQSLRAKIYPILLVSMISAMMLGGCGKRNGSNETEKQSEVVFQYGDHIVTSGETYIYAKAVEERYVDQYGEAVWQLILPATGSDATSMVDLTREAIVEEIVKVKTLVEHAKDYGIGLSDEEISLLKTRAHDFYEGLTDADIEKMNITEELVYQVLYENQIAGIVTEKIFERNPVEISDETARMTTFYDMYFACYTIDDSGTVVPYTSEEKKQQYENALQACSTLGTGGITENHEAENIEKLAEYYKLDQAKEQTLSPQEILEIYGEEVYNLLYSMENGEYTTVIETEYGYHVFQMIALTDARATKENKDIMTAKQTEEQMASRMEAWRNQIDENFSYPESINMDLYKTIVVD